MAANLNALAGRFAGKRVLVTGGTGPLGRRLVEILAKESRVHLLTRDVGRAGDLWPGLSVHIHRGDLQELPLLNRLCDSTDTIFHLASYSPAPDEIAPEDNPEHMRVTVEGTRRLLDAAESNGVRRFLFCSSTRAIDGENTVYGRAKQQAEALVLAAGEAGMAVSVLRLAPLYGFADRGNIAMLTSAVKKGRFPPIPEFRDRRSLLHCDDAIQAILLAASSPTADGKIYTVTDLQVYSSRQIYQLSCRSVGRAVPRWSVPTWLLKSGAVMGDLIESVTGNSAPLNSRKLSRLTSSAWFDGGQIRDELGFMPLFDLEKYLMGEDRSQHMTN